MASAIENYDQSDDEPNSELIIEGSLTPTSNDQEKTSPQRQLTMGPNQDQHADYITVKRKQFKNVPKGQPTMHSENWQEKLDDASPKRQPTMEQSQATNRKRKAEESQAQSNKRLNITNIIYISFAKDKIPSRMTFTKSIRNLTKVQYPGQTRDLKTGLGYSIKPESPQIAQIITQANLEVLFPDTEVKIGGRQHMTNQPKKKQTSSFVISRVSEQLSEADIQSELEEINNIKVAKLFRIQTRSLDKPTQLIRVFTDDDLACRKAIENGVYICNELKRCEASKTEPRVTQCYKCQNFGHMAINCPNQQRCLRCGDNHAVRDCKIPKQQVKCINCRGEHPAQYKGCPVYKTAHVEAQKAQPKVQSYAQVVKPQPTTTVVKPQPTTTETQPTMSKEDIQQFIKETVETTIADQVEKAVQKAMDEKITDAITKAVAKSCEKINETVSNVVKTQFEKIDFTELLTSNIKAKQNTKTHREASSSRHSNSRNQNNNNKPK